MNDLVPSMEAAWELILGGEEPDKVIVTYRLDEKAFKKYVRRRITGLSTLDQMREKALQLGQLNELLRSWWTYAKMDPKFGRLVLDVMKSRRELIFPNLPSGITPEKLGDVIDMERVNRVIKESKERKNAQKETGSVGGIQAGTGASDDD